jgi:hypothetical protein
MLACTVSGFNPKYGAAAVPLQNTSHRSNLRLRVPGGGLTPTSILPYSQVWGFPKHIPDADLLL